MPAPRWLRPVQVVVLAVAVAAAASAIADYDASALTWSDVAASNSARQLSAATNTPNGRTATATDRTFAIDLRCNSSCPPGVAGDAALGSSVHLWVRDRSISLRYIAPGVGSEMDATLPLFGDLEDGRYVVRVSLTAEDQFHSGEGRFPGDHGSEYRLAGQISLASLGGEVIDSNVSVSLPVPHGTTFTSNDNAARIAYFGPVSAPKYILLGEVWE